MIKKLVCYIIGIALTGWSGCMVIIGILHGGFPVLNVIGVFLGIALIIHAHTIKVKQHETT